MLKVCQKGMGFIEPFESAPVLYFNHNYNNIVSKKVNKQVNSKKLGILTRVGTIVDLKKALKQVGVVHNFITVASVMCIFFLAWHAL